MAASSSIYVTPTVSIPRSELEFRASRSGGPGGQHVNTSSTRIELLWDVSASQAVTEEQAERIRHKLAARLDAEGRVRIVASDRRSQQQNRASAEERLAMVVRQALAVPKKRRPTRPSAASKERRLSEKKHRSEKKRERRPELD